MKKFLPQLPLNELDGADPCLTPCRFSVIAALVLALLAGFPAPIRADHDPAARVIVIKPTPEEARHVQWGKKFIGECYERAFQYLKEHPDIGARLVHGTIEARPARVLGHAWVLVRSGVFDPVQQNFFDKASYYRILKAKEIRVYSHGEALSRFSRGTLLGPWLLVPGVIHKLPGKDGKEFTQ